MGAGRESIGRTILVVEDQPYLWAVLRARVERATAYVRSVTPDELPDGWRGCRPWPWLVVGATKTVPDPLPALLDGRPIAVHWLGEPPPALGRRAVAHADWSTLVAELGRLNDLTTRGVGGVRLMRNRGVRAPDGRLVLGAAELEGLLAAPGGLPLPHDGQGERTLIAMRRVIATHSLPVRLQRDGEVVRLA